MLAALPAPRFLPKPQYASPLWLPQASTICVWDVAKRQLIHTIPDAHGGKYVRCILSLPGGMVASGGRDNRVRLWEWKGRKGELVEAEPPREGHSHHVCDLAQASKKGGQTPEKGGHIVSVGCDSVLHLWQVGGLLQQSLCRLEGHTDRVNAVAVVRSSQPPCRPPSACFCMPTLQLSLCRQPSTLSRSAGAVLKATPRLQRPVLLDQIGPTVICVRRTLVAGRICTRRSYPT